MATENPQPAFNAFQAQLRTLCLNEFPCGIGTWRENHNKNKKVIQNNKVASQFSITLKDYGANYEKTENLEELTSTKKSPWNLDYSWSEEAKALREIAVKSPWLVDERFILSHFKTLRIVDKGVTDVDENFLKFPNLEELTLSANKLLTVKSTNLPQNLRVLELCANSISHLEDLCMKPPHLMHLGMGHNSLTLTDDYLTATYWPQLLSLDLSHNNLSDLLDIVRKLQTLPKLRNLLLQGNPLSLVPAYRGYVIDSLRELDFLDDISISADEKHHYKGLARRREYILDEAKVLLQVDFIKGILQPDELKFPDEQPEFPVVTRNYYVEFMYLEDKSADAEILDLLRDDACSGSQTDRTDQTDDRQTEKTAADSVGDQGDQPASIMSHDQGSHDQGSHKDSRVGSSAEKNVIFAEVNTARSQSVASESQVELGELGNHGDVQTPIPTPSLDDNSDNIPAIRLAPIKCASSTWMEEMELNWHEMVVRDDLLSLRNFLTNGMDIAVIEEKILSYPADQVMDGVISPAGGKDKTKTDKKEKKDDKKKDDKKGPKGKKQPTPQPAKDDGKKKKKKGEPDIEMAHMPAEYTDIARFHVPLEDFLEGEFVFENVFIKSWESLSGTQTPMSELSTSSKDKKKKSDKKKDGKEKEKDVRKSPKVDRKGSSKPKDKGKVVAEPVGDDEPPPPPAPLEVHVKVRLHHWKTAMDSIRDEQEAQAAAAEAATASDGK